MAGLAGALFFLLVFGSFHWLDPGVSVVRNYVSDYANGPYGRLFQAATLIHGIGNLAIAVGLGLVVGSPAGKWATRFFGLASIGILIAGAVATDPEGVPRTVAGSIHLAAGFSAFAIEALALALFAYAFGRLHSWKTVATMTIIVAALGIVSLNWLLIAIVRGLEPGLPERAGFLAFMSWEIFIGLRLAVDMRGKTDNEPTSAWG